MGYDEELLQMISILLGCNKEDFAEGNSIKSNVVQNIVRLVKETAFSHLMEVSNLLLSFAFKILPKYHFPLKLIHFF